MRRPWFFGPVIGAAVGFVFLGVGGRVAMWGLRVLTHGDGGFSVGGTLTVLFMGAVNGAVGGGIRGLTDIGGRLPLPLRFALFGFACLALALRGLRPVDTERLVLFLPLVAAYALFVELAWRRLPRWKISPVSGTLSAL